MEEIIKKNQKKSRKARSLAGFVMVVSISLLCRHSTTEALLSESELFDECAVTFEVCAFKVAEHLAALTYNFKKSAFCISILWKELVVLCELLNTLCHDSDLNLYITCISFFCAVLLYCCGCCFF